MLLALLVLQNDVLLIHNTSTHAPGFSIYPMFLKNVHQAFLGWACRPVM